MKKTLAVILAAAALMLAAGVRAADLPNVVLIFIDDMGYADIGPFGNTQVRTPNLDRMATEGMKFSNFYATPLCSMSRACLMTGCYNARVSIPGVLFPGDKIGLNPDEITLAEIVKPKGYATACIGKWHLGHYPQFLPTRQGFDSYFGVPYSNDMTIDPAIARFAKDCVFREGMTEAGARKGTAPNRVPLMRGEEVVEYAAEQDTLTKRYTEEAIRFIREHKAGPFFVYLPHNMIHFPLAASESFRGKSRMGLVGDAIEEVDWSVGQILATLKELGLDEKTLVIFTSDNGPAARTAPPFRGSKGTSLEGGVREPCIMRWPGRIPAGTTCQQIAGNIDVLPTLAKLADSPLPADRVLDGRDITSLMFNAGAGPVRDTHLYFNANQRLQAIRQGEWKLFVLSQPQKNAKNAQELALYNLAADPGESKDLSGEHPDIVARLRAEAERREAEVLGNKRPVGRAGDPNRKS